MQNQPPPVSPQQIPGSGYSPASYPTPPNNNRHRRENIKGIITTIAILALAPILALSITAFVFQSYEVDGPSMQTTLETNDRLIVWKAGRTWARITGSDYIPPRGTIIVFVKKGEYDFNSGNEKQLIKRIIGLPGERVVVKDGKITVYNSEHPEGFDPDATMDYGHLLLGETVGNVDIDIKEGELFVIGDHRNNSLDSRSFGAIPSTDIVGTLSARILPLSEAKKF